jgi:molecular chaperone DnaK
MSEKIVGIDLGTSNSSAAVMEGGKTVIIPSAEGTTIVGGKAFPSYVAFTKDGQVLVGEPARRQASVNPEGTVFAAKRKMGTDHKYNIYGKSYTPEQISAFILQKIKKDIESYLGQPVKKAVVTVPAYFNDNQRQATKDAGTIAGLEVVRLINEPTAASFAFGLDKLEEELKILVFDFGAGTLDVTVMDMMAGVFQVLSTSGDTLLGGTDMDEALVKYIVDEFKKESGIDVSKDKMAMQRLREAAEKAKIELSSTVETDISLPFITADQNGPKHLQMKIRRAKLEELISPIIDKCKEPVKKAIEDAKLKSSDIGKVILVGGPTRIPMVQAFVEELIGIKPERGVDPMECVSVGAAIQGAILSGDMKDKDILLLDVTPLSLGVETLGGVFTKIIERNTTIPAKKSQVFSTAADNQPSVEINVLQGERTMAKDNLSLGNFQLVGIPPAPRGLPQIEVSFDIDANGILNVAAKDKGTGKEQSIKITASKKLSDEDIDRMVKESEQHAEEDKKNKEVIEVVNQADSLVYTVNKTVDEHKDKIGDDDKKNIQDKVDALNNLLKNEVKDVEAIKKGMDELQEASHKIAQLIYQQSQEAQQEQEQPTQEGQPQQEEPQRPEGDNVVDAEYKEVDGQDDK